MLKKLINYRKRANNLIRLFYQHALYLEPGSYVIDGKLKLIYKNDAFTKKFAEEYIIKNNNNLISDRSFKSIVKQIVIPKEVFNNNPGVFNKQNFKGNIYLPANNTEEKRDVKIFDFEKLEVLTIYSSLYNYNSKIFTYNYFKDYFPIPKLIKYDKNERITIEEIILAKPKKEWDKDNYRNVIDSIFYFYERYFLKCKKKNKYSLINPEEFFKQAEADVKLKEVVNNIKQNIPKELVNSHFPSVMQHGDLWFYNILLERNEQTCYWIDWEHAKEYYFFYDIFWWMQNEAIYNNDYTYIKNYLYGEYDKHFKKMFRIFEIPFYKELRYAYLNIALIEIINKRVLNKDELIKSAVVNNFMQFLKIIKQL